MEFFYHHIMPDFSFLINIYYINIAVLWQYLMQWNCLKLRVFKTLLKTLSWQFRNIWWHHVRPSIYCFISRKIRIYPVQLSSCYATWAKQRTSSKKLYNELSLETIVKRRMYTKLCWLFKVFRNWCPRCLCSIISIPWWHIQEFYTQLT